MSLRRRILLAFWRLANPLARPLAGRVRWWVLLETKGHRSGIKRSTPLATGPWREDEAWLIAVHGERASWVRNIRADRRVRIRHAGRWRAGSASIEPVEPARLREFGWYPRLGLITVGIEPRLVRIRLDPQDRTGPLA